MKRRRALVVLSMILFAAVAGVLVLFRLRLGQGDSFPVYSSLRADPLGTRALHDGLDLLPEFHVERHLKVLESLPLLPPRTIVLAGLDTRRWHRFRERDFEALDAAVRAGSRLVITMRAESASDDADPSNARKGTDWDDPEEDAPEPNRDPAPSKEKAEKPSADPGKSDQPEKRPSRPRARYVDPQGRWGIELKERWLFDRDAGAVRAALASPALPESIAWRSDLHFAPNSAAPWRTLYTRANEPVLVERGHGLGSIVLAADSYFLSNECLQRERSTELLAWVIGPHRHVVFDEYHLGVIETPGIAALARRYGLGGAFVTFLLLAALFVWQRTAIFVPPTAELPELALNYHPAAGLESLLRRAVKADELAAVCTAEWKRTAKENDVRRVEAAIAAEPGRTSVERYNSALRVLRRRQIR